MTLAYVSVKIGVINKTSRTNVEVEKPTFTFEEGSETSAGLSARVEAIVSAALHKYKVKTVREDTTIYLKPSLGAKQVTWVDLNAANWRDNLAVAQRNHHKCKKDQGPFVFRLFVFAAKEAVSTGVSIRRATTSRIQEESRVIDKYLSEHGELRVGPIARFYWYITYARLPDGTEAPLPDNAAFR